MIKVDEEYDYLHKVMVVGATGAKDASHGNAARAGASNLISRFTRNKFSLETRSSIGVGFATRCIQIEGKYIKLQIWDCASSTRLHFLPAEYRGWVGCMLVYDIASKSSFEAVKGILDLFRENSDRNARYMLVGNKSDLRHLREVTSDKAKQFAEENNMDFIETSALDGHNVECAFHQIATSIYETMSKPLEIKQKEQEQSSWESNRDKVFDIIKRHIENYQHKVENAKFFKEGRKIDIQKIREKIYASVDGEAFLKKFDRVIKDILLDHIINSFPARWGVTKSRLHQELIAARNELISNNYVPQDATNLKSLGMRNNAS